MSNELLILLQKPAQESPAHRAFFEILARRTNDANVTKVDRILGLLLNDGVQVVRQDLVKLMQRLGELGFGRFVMGRHSKPSRFEWQTSALGVARAAVEEANEINSSPMAQPVGDTDPEDSREDDVLEHRFHLRPAFSAVLELPLDLTQSEAERLASFIRTLPIGNNN